MEAAVKLAGLTMTGGEAKACIQEGLAAVNGEKCTMRGKKLYPGDTFSFDGQLFAVERYDS